MLSNHVVFATAAALLLFALAAEASSGSDSSSSQESTVLFVFTESCWAKYTNDFDFLDRDCLKSTVSKAVGLGIVVASFLLKAPQIYNIVKAKSGAGLELSSLYLDVVAFMCPAVYSFRLGYDFFTYGESVVILVQNIVIVLLVWSYSAKPISVGHKLLVIVGLGALTAAAFALPEEFLSVLPSITIMFVIASRVPQIVANFRTRDTGVASSITWLLNFVGAFIRVLTTLSETGDLLQASSFGLGATCSATILCQICIYGSPSSATKKDAKDATTAKDKKDK